MLHGWVGFRDCARVCRNIVVSRGACKAQRASVLGFSFSFKLQLRMQLRRKLGSPLSVVRNSTAVPMPVVARILGTRSSPTCAHPVGVGDR